MIICRHCRKETDETKTNCEHCGHPLTQGLLAYAKARQTGQLSAPAPTAKTPPEMANADAMRESAEAQKAGKPPTGPLQPSDVPHSAVIYFFAESFFKVKPSGERSIIAKMFGSNLTLQSLCSAMLFAAYAANVSKHLIRLRVAAATTTGPLCFPIQAQWVRILSEPLGLYRDKQTTIEGRLMEHLKGRGLTSDATQRSIADLIDWPHALSPSEKRAKAPPPHTWDRHYAEALTSTVRRYAAVIPKMPADAPEQTELMVRQFCKQDEKTTEYLSHEINVIIQWLAKQQDALVQKRVTLLNPQGTNPLELTATKLYDNLHWQTLAKYSKREF